MSFAFVFPGQGSQAVGMGKALAAACAAARDVFAEVDAALAQDLSKLMWEGPEAELTLTENAQPAVYYAEDMELLRTMGLKLVEGRDFTEQDITEHDPNTAGPDEGFPKNVMPKSYSSLPATDLKALVDFLTKPQG